MNPLFLGSIKTLLLLQALQGTIVGRVWDAETAAPVAGAVVTLTDLDRAAATDESGRYVFQRVSSGRHQLVVRGMGFAPRSLHALVPENGRLEVDVWLVAEPVRLDAIDVRAPVFVRDLDIGSSAAFPDREISADAIRNHPLLAQPDAFEALSGGEVSLAPETPSGVHIRGGSSDETAYLLDGIPVFNPYHSGGVSSGWNPDAISRVHLASSFPLQSDPNALSGTIEASTRAPEDRVHGQGSASTTQSRATFDGPIGAAGAGYLVSVRSGLPDGFAPKNEPTYLRGESRDWLAKLEAPALGGRIELLGYGNENELNTAAFASPEGSPPDPRRNTFEWTSRSIGLQWKRAFSGANVRVLGWRADGDAGSLWAARAGSVNMAAARHDLGLLATVERRSGRASTLGELRVEQSRTSYATVSDSAADWALWASTPVVTAAARHGRAIGRRLTLSLAATLAATRGEQRLGPSAKVIWSAADKLILSASYARRHQFAQSLRNEESIVGNVFPVDLYVGAGAGGIPVARSDAGVIAASYRPRAALRLGAQVYERRSDGLVLVAPREGGPFATGAFDVGSGVARGFSTEASLSAKRYGVVLSYGLQHVRLGSGNSAYAPQHGATHRLQCGVIVFPGASATIRLGATAAMGRRATAIQGGFEWEANNMLDRGSEFAGNPYYDGAALGGTALPAYYRIDLGVRKQWRFGVMGRDANLALFATATNLLGRKNILTYAKDPSTGDPVGVEMRPLSPLLVGLDWGF